MCAICRADVIKTKHDGSDSIIGEMAHIEGEKPNAARYNVSMTDKERQHYSNLILLCPTCHTIIDNDELTYTTINLKTIKTNHENWVKGLLAKNVPNVTFAELEVVVKYLTANPVSDVGLATLLTPKEKIKKNGLPPDVEHLITIGMLQSKQVKHYLNQNPDDLFAERLRAGFVNEYEKLKSEGLQGEDIFYALLDFTQQPETSLINQAAGLSVLVYFFEICEVLEK
jgi:hypothetical protein